MTEAQRHALQSVAAQLRAGAARGWNYEARQAHAHAARVLLEDLAGPPGAAALAHLRADRHAEALAAVDAALAEAPPA